MASNDIVVFNSQVYSLDDIPDSVKQELIERLSSKQGFTKPELSQIYNLYDFESIAKKVLTGDTFFYYKTGAADEITLNENELAFRRIYLKPRILENVRSVSLKRTILGSNASSPFYITAFAGADLDGNVDAEKPLSLAASKTGVIQMIPSLSPFPVQELAKFNEKDQWLQIYVGEDRNVTVDLIKRAEATGKVKALFFTVDTAQLGRRETQLRKLKDSKFVKELDGHDSNLDWDDIKKLREVTKLKIGLKGVQTLEDVLKAIEYGFDSVLISNHGGRQLDTARSAIEILAEVFPILKSRGLFDKIEILIDGGIRRGSDVVKAIALGARGVGLGRPFLYALQTYGEEGVSRVIEILNEEVELTLRLLGVDDINKIDERYIDTLDLFGNRAVHSKQ